MLIALLTKGRLTVAQVGQHTSLGARHVRNGLGVLIQQNILYHHSGRDSSATTYEANHDACYNLLRTGKILQVIESQYGNAERDLVQTLLLLGHAKISDLTQAFESRNPKPKVNGHTNGSHVSPTGLIQSENHLMTVLAHLVQDEIIETVLPESLRNPLDVYHEIVADVTHTGPGEKSTKNKVEQLRQVHENFRIFLDHKRLLKRQLDQAEAAQPGKRRKLQNGNHNGTNGMDDAPELDVR